jgi:hypothetical protein
MINAEEGAKMEVGQASARHSLGRCDFGVAQCVMGFQLSVMARA